MKTLPYIHAIKMGYLGTAAYPHEFIAYLMRKLIRTASIMFFWTMLLKLSETTQAQLGSSNLTQLLSYFLIADAVRDITFSNDTRLARRLIYAIKYGWLSNKLIQPINPSLYYFFEYVGERLMHVIFSFLMLLIGLALYAPKSIWDICIFITYILISTVLSYFINMAIGSIAFYSGEAADFKNAYENIIVILSGQFIPLTFFPQAVQNILLLTPFPSMAFTPVMLIQGKLGPQQIINAFAISIVWTLIMSFIATKFWKRSLKVFEGVGI